MNRSNSSDACSAGRLRAADQTRQAGVASIGARFDAKDFLRSLTPQYLTLG